MSSNDKSTEHKVPLHLQQSDDQQPLIDQLSDLRSSVDEDSVDSASTSDSLVRRAFL